MITAGPILAYAPMARLLPDEMSGRAIAMPTLRLKFAAVPGVLRGSIREVDLFLLQGRSPAAEVRAGSSTSITSVWM